MTAGPILIVAQDSKISAILSQVLDAHTCDYRVVTSGEQALDVADKIRPTIVIMSVSLPDQDGWLVCRKLKSTLRPIHVLLMTKELTDSATRFAKFVRADAILPEPPSEDDIRSLGCRVSVV
jgi:DNA-binding response OmpR family regulator